MKNKNITIYVANSRYMQTYIVLNGVILETFHDFNFLASKITSDGKSHLDTMNRKAQTKYVFSLKRRLFIMNTVSLDTKKTHTKTFVWRIVLHGGDI